MAGLCACNPRRRDKYDPFVWREKLVFLAGRFPILALRSVWVLDRLCKAYSMAQSNQYLHCNSLRFPLPLHLDVLLVAAWTTQSTIMVCLRSPLRNFHDLELDFALRSVVAVTPPPLHFTERFSKIFLADVNLSPAYLGK